MMLTKNNVLRLLRDAGVNITYEKDKPNYTQKKEDGNIEMNLTSSEDGPMETMVAMHEVFHAWGFLKNRIWLVSHREIVEELAANEFARLMTDKMGKMTKAVKEKCDSLQKRLLKNINNKKTAIAFAETRAKFNIKAITKELS